MKRLVALLLAAGLVSACGEGKRVVSGAMLAQQSDNAPRSYLALEHTIKLDAPEERVSPILNAAKAACARVAQHGCTVLESHVSSGDGAYARVKMRATPAGVRAVIGAVAPQGKLIEQSTTTEDLAKPIQDGARKIAMLTEYRTKLEALARAPGIDTDALIKLNRELAEVQSQLEALGGAQAHLNLRVQTEILNVQISEASTAAFSKPIAQAFASFASNLSKGIALTISAIAFLIPAGLALALIVWGWKMVRGRSRRRAAYRAQSV